MSHPNDIQLEFTDKGLYKKWFLILRSNPTPPVQRISVLPNRLPDPVWNILCLFAAVWSILHCAVMWVAYRVWHVSGNGWCALHGILGWNVLDGMPWVACIVLHDVHKLCLHELCLLWCFCFVTFFVVSLVFYGFHVFRKRQWSGDLSPSTPCLEF